MEEYKRLQSKLDEKTYKEFELFWINNTNFTEIQANKFVNLLEKITNHSEEVKLQQFQEQ